MRKYRPDWPKIYSLFVKTSQFLLVFLIIFTGIIYFLARGRVDNHTRQINEDLQIIYQDGIYIKIQLDETIPVELSIPIDELVDINQLIPDQVLINTTVPINTTFRVNQTVSLPVDIPLLGRAIVDLPLDLDIPVEQEIPIDTIIDIDPSAFKDPGTIVYINQDIPINMPVELNFSVEDLGLETGFEGVESLIDTLRFIFLLKKLD